MLDEDTVVDLVGRRLHVQAPQAYGDRSRLGWFLDRCEDLAFNVTVSIEAKHSEGIDLGELIDSGDSGGECQICGAEMTEGVMVCRACKTRHHEECWRYYGACSTFGCGERAFVSSAGRVE